ncbi:MAG: hypothetical protein V2B17_04995, partial [Chloroflexota bacterium]
MTDTITESFCERCGTRFSFEQTAKARRGGIGRIRVLTRGLKNYVANDGMPMDEALAAARNDEERAGVSRQLDAFHRTFKFCMSCRQYTCANCWNEKAVECLTCAPDLTHEVLPSPFPDPALVGPAAADDPLPDSGVVAPASWPTTDLARVTANAPAAARQDVATSIPAPDLPARRDAFPAAPSDAEAEELTAAELAEIETALTAAHPALESPAEPAAADQAPGPALPIAMVADAAPEPGNEPPVATSLDHAAATARGQTRGLLARFRPGRRPGAAPSADASDERAATAAQQSFDPLALPEPAAESASEPEPVSEPEPEPAPVQAAAEPEPVSEPEPVQAAAEPEPVSEPEPAPEPASAPADTIEQPTWRVVAPEAAPAPRPDWPDAPAWPSPDPHASQAPGSAA